MKNLLNKRVRLCKSQSVNHFKIANMPITGEVIKIDNSNRVGLYFRPYLIRFDDNRKAWYSKDEFKESK